MRLLIVKTSSLGDVIHYLPALSDIRRHFPQARIDWCVEESFAAIPPLHPALGEIVPVALRRWRKQLLQGKTWNEIGALRQRLQAARYDLVIDSQGLLKSALLARQVAAPHAGYDAESIREPLASRLYERRYRVSRDLHAVVRNRLLTAAALGYNLDCGPDYGITAPAADFAWRPEGPYVVLLSATSRDDKLWPEDHWIELGHELHRQGLRALLPGGNPVERERAARLAAAIPEAIAVPPQGIGELAALLAGARAVVGVDTGLTHLAVALDTPTVALYTATDPGLTGVYGRAFCRNLGGKGKTPAVKAVLGALAEAG
ncbi:lipopolysaccharide heptosyltransferase I [Dechloromonas sp. ZY10]|uniref:lipopolysaccharide heptosyltransferase I n=1 Tax=Dechloromonas aquae TaxID=2664436 RepID=UPI0035293E4B